MFNDKINKTLHIPGKKGKRQFKLQAFFSLLLELTRSSSESPSNWELASTPLGMAPSTSFPSLTLTGRNLDLLYGAAFNALISGRFPELLDSRGGTAPDDELLNIGKSGSWCDESSDRSSPCRAEIAGKQKLGCPPLASLLDFLDRDVFSFDRRGLPDILLLLKSAVIAGSKAVTALAVGRILLWEQNQWS